MSRRIPVVAAAILSVLCIYSTRAGADENMKMTPDEHNRGSIGFHSSDAPLGVRWWLGGEKVGLDLGFGFHSDPAGGGYPSDKVTGWAVDFGIPIVMKSWDRVHVLFRPGLLYGSQQVVSSAFPAPFATENEKSFGISGEIEAEAFLLENFSVSASTGVRYESLDPPGPGDKLTSFSTIGEEFTNVGFHAYLFH